MEERIEKQELYCHACGRYVQFPVDLSMDGKYVLNCPKCGHEHCRIVKNGMITEERFDSRNNGLPVFVISSGSMTTTASSASSSTLTYSVRGTATNSATFTYSGFS